MTYPNGRVVQFGNQTARGSAGFAGKPMTLAQPKFNPLASKLGPKGRRALFTALALGGVVGGAQLGGHLARRALKRPDEDPNNLATSLASIPGLGIKLSPLVGALAYN